MPSDQSADGNERECPRCGEPAKRILFALGDPAAPEKRTFQCKNDGCLQARFYRSVNRETAQGGDQP